MFHTRNYGQHIVIDAYNLTIKEKPIQTELQFTKLHGYVDQPLKSFSHLMLTF